MIPIDEQIKHQQNTVKIIEDFDDKESLPKEQAILASLERLKAIDSVQVPEEPVVMTKTFMRGRTMEEHEVVFKHDYDTLRDLLKREIARASEWEAEADNQFQYAGRVLEQSNAAESKLSQIEKMGREPSMGMCKAGGSAISLNGGEGGDLEMESDAQEAFTAMFNKMMEELK
jgi:hypothetical protein